ncbi:MAG: lasso peptide biosynthesis protein [Solirubrobacteraceae bacterium]|nr:lasso peptide biosynthesis protein [Solirubrobacteraceae bacterium]
MLRRAIAAGRGWLWARSALRVVRAEVRDDGLGVAVPPPPTVRRGSLRGARLALRRDSASCLEKSLVIQRWYASSGIALDVIVGVRHPDLKDGPTAHAWVEHFDADCSDRFAEIRRVQAPAGKPPRLVG